MPELYLLDDENCPYTFGQLLYIFRTGKNPITGQQQEFFMNMRCRNSLSQSQLGDLLGRDKNWVSRQETGQVSAPPEAEIIEKIADLLACSEIQREQLIWAAQCESLRKKGFRELKPPNDEI